MAIRSRSKVAKALRIVKIYFHQATFLAITRKSRTRLMIPIDDATLNYVGGEIEEQFGVEYLECSRDKLGNIKTSNCSLPLNTDSL